MAKRIIPMEPGERDTQITIQKLTETKGGSGFPVENWTTEPPITLFARRDDLRSGERFEMNQIAASATTRWEVNYRADLDPDVIDVPKMRRVVYRGRTYGITGASLIGRQEGVELLTLEGTR